MKTLSWVFILLGSVVCASCSEEKLLLVSKNVEVAQRISSCTVEAVRALFTSSNDILIIFPNRFYHMDILQQILSKSFSNRPVKLLENFWTKLNDQPQLSAKDSSILLIMNHAYLPQLLEHTSVERWSEYIIVTEATTVWLSKFAEHLWSLGFVKVAFVRVTSNGSSTLLRMTKNSSSRTSPPTLKAFEICKENLPSFVANNQPENVIIYPFSSWFHTPTKATVRYARIVEGSENPSDFGVIENGTMNYFGNDVINIFTKKRNLVPRMIVWENQTVSTWDDAMKRCVAGEIDIFYTVLPPGKAAFSGLIEPITWYRFEALIFVYNPKRPPVSLMSFLVPYSKIVWMGTIILTGAFASFALAVERLWYRGLIRERITILDVWAIFTIQSLSTVPTKFGLRFVLGMWLLFNLNSSILYSSTFSSALTTTTYRHYLKNFDDIINSDKSICGGTRSKEFLEASNNSVLRQICERYEEVSPIAVIDKVIEEKYIGARHRTYVEKYNWINRANGSRRLCLIDEAIIASYPSLYFAKKRNPHSKELKRTISIAHETGLVKRLFDEYKVKVTRRQGNTAVSMSDDQVLHMKHMMVAFEILFIGHLISGLVYLVEIYHHKRSTKKLANRKS